MQQGYHLSITLKVKNTGKMDGDEVVQAYIEYPQIDRMPLKELKGFKRVSVYKRSASKSVHDKNSQLYDLAKMGYAKTCLDSFTPARVYTLWYWAVTRKMRNCSFSWTR